MLKKRTVRIAVFVLLPLLCYTLWGAFDLDDKLSERKLNKGDRVHVWAKAGEMEGDVVRVGKHGLLVRQTKRVGPGERSKRASLFFPWDQIEVIEVKYHH